MYFSVPHFVLVKVRGHSHAEQMAKLSSAIGKVGGIITANYSFLVTIF
jgi:hypothetical protein